MFDATLNRRHFLKGSSGALLGTLLFTSGPIALVAPSLTWALDLHHLDSALALRLMAVVKRLYPHDGMEDAVYAFAVQALDRQAGQDSALGGLLRDGLDALDRDAGETGPRAARPSRRRSCAPSSTRRSSGRYVPRRHGRCTATSWPTATSATRAPPSARAAT